MFTVSRIGKRQSARPTKEEESRTPFRRWTVRSGQRANGARNKKNSKNIPRIGGAGVDDLHDDEGVQEVASDHIRAEGRRFLLKYDSNDVVADVPFALQLLRIARAVRQQRGHVEQHLAAAEYLVHRRIAGLAVPSVQAAAITKTTSNRVKIESNEKEYDCGRRNSIDMPYSSGKNSE